MSFSDRRPYPVDRWADSRSPVPPSVGPKPSVGLEEVKTDPLNRFDAVSAYMRKMDHYGLSDF